MRLCYCFVASRRRHTRLQGDWSSDVCSSDLERSIRSTPSEISSPTKTIPLSLATDMPRKKRPNDGSVSQSERSEERRVGKSADGGLRHRCGAKRHSISAQKK